MKKPSLNLDLDPKIKDFIAKKIIEHRSKLIRYCLFKKGITEFDPKKMKTAYEKIPFYSVDILTFRYDGELLFREFPSGSDMNLYNRSYVIDSSIK